MAVERELCSTNSVSAASAGSKVALPLKVLITESPLLTTSELYPPPSFSSGTFEAYEKNIEHQEKWQKSKCNNSFFSAGHQGFKKIENHSEGLP